MPPAKTLRDAYNSANPAEPLTPHDPRYVNCTDVRGDEDTVAYMFTTISFSDTPTHQLFTGHRGCGKSTELLRLKDDLVQAGFFVVYFAVDEYLDPNDLIYTDLLLAVARQVVEACFERGVDLSEPLKTIETWFSEVVYQRSEWENVEQELQNEASLGFGLPQAVPLIARFLTKLTGQIKTGDAVRTDIRGKLDSQISQLVQSINELLDRAHAEVRRSGKQGIAVIVDNLDRVTFKVLGDDTPTDSGVRRTTSHDALFIDHGEQLRALRCHVVYTVPISMMYGQSARALCGIFPDYRVLPMIKVHEPRANGGGDLAGGLERLKGILSHRIELDVLCEPEAVEYLCRACGGHPRDLMTLVRHAVEYAVAARSPVITLNAVQRAEARLVTAYDRMIPEDHYKRLVAVHLTNDIENDSEHKAMLYNQSVLEYANGKLWHDVHPAVQKLSRFRRLLEDEHSRLSA